MRSRCSLNTLIKYILKNSSQHKGAGCKNKHFPKKNNNKSILEVFGCTVDELSSVLQALVLVVVEQASLPDGPGGGIVQFGNGTVEQSDGRSTVIVVRDPFHSLCM